MSTQTQAADQAVAELAATRDDRWYPTFHIAPEAGWINDANGVCHYRGRYHVFFQHYPYAAAWGPMHWGHVSSADLVRWRHEPVALAPSLEEDKDGVWSGSAIEAPDGRLLVFYTGHRWRNGVDEAEGNIQMQCLAVSDDAVHFEKQGPVVTGPEELLHFRDPKVWLQDGVYYMVFGASSAQQRGQVWMYTSTDLATWTFDRIVFEDPDPDVYMLECPDMFELDGHWVITYCPMSSARRSGYGGRNGHNGGYIVGDWAPGSDFTPLRPYTQGDWGHSFYAAQSMLAPDGRRLTFGWMGGFTLPLASQAADGWSGQLAIPRELRLTDDLDLAARPIREIEQLRHDSVDLGAFTLGADEEKVLVPDAGPVEIELVVDLDASDAEQIALLVHHTGPGLFTKVAYDDLAERIVVDRGLTSSTDRGYRAAPRPGLGELTLRVFVDRGSVEVFVDDGTTAVSSLSFPGPGPRAVTLATVAGSAAVTALRIHELSPIWEQQG